MALWNKVNNSIHKKIFILISSILIVTSIVIYEAIIYVMPKYYFYNKNQNLNRICIEFVDEIKGKSLSETSENFEMFINKYKGDLVEILIFDKEGKYVKLPYNKYNEYAIPEEKELLTEDRCYEEYRYYLGDPIEASRYERKLRFNEDSDSVKFLMKRYTCNLRGEKYTMYFSFYLQPIKEASEVLVNFIPYIGFIELLIALVIGWLYSKKVTKPIITISSKAEEMARSVDLSIRCKVEGNDEIFILGKSLNNLASELEDKIKEKENKNNMLLQDIKIEKESEKRRLDFFNAASHELKTPITILRGQLEGMLFKVGIYNDREKYINNSLIVVRKMEKLVDEIKEISIVEDKNVGLVFSDVNISDLVYESIDILKEIAISRRVSINEIEIKDDVIVSGDKRLLMKVISNVIKNAIVHSPKGEKIRINLNRDSLVVINSGVNIPNEDINKIFNAYYRVEKSRNRSNGGTGLGLYIVKEILDIHKFSFNICNEGCSVKFLINFSYDKGGIIYENEFE